MWSCVILRLPSLISSPVTLPLTLPTPATHAHTHAQAHAHTHKHTRTHTRTSTRTSTHMHMHTRTCTHCTYAHAHTCAHTHTHAHTLVQNTPSSFLPGPLHWLFPVPATPFPSIATRLALVTQVSALIPGGLSSSVLSQEPQHFLTSHPRR